MGRWAQRQKRGGGGNISFALPAPVLSFNGVDTLNWVYTATDPFSWHIENAPFPAGPWADYDSAGGAERSYVGVTAQSYRISGTDAGDGRITAYSNVVSF